MSRFIILCCILCAAFEIGCVSTRVTSIVDLDYRDSSYSRFLVISNYNKLELAKGSEEHLVQLLKDSGVFAISNIELLPPLRKYSDSTVAAIYKKYNFDAYIIITPAGDSTEKYYTSNGFPMMGTNMYPGFGTYGGTSVTTMVTTAPMNYQRTSYYDTKIELFDARTKMLVCRCESSSEQTSSVGGLNEGSMTDYRMFSICSKVVEEFGKNRLFKNSSSATTK